MPKNTTTQGKKAKNKKIHKQPQKFEGSCFVLMPFKEPFDTYYSSIIEPAITACHLEPLRGDSLFRPSPIMGDIWQMIQNAKVLVSELTEKNANVFYELGLAHAIGKPVILISETIEDVPFDLQPLRVILYNKSNPAWGVDLKADLISSIKETSNDLVRAVPPMFRKSVKSQAPEDSDIAIRLSELERRVASINTIRPENISIPTREQSINWSEVINILQNNNKLNSLDPKLESRAHAVAWVISNSGRFPFSFLQRRLENNKLPPSEVRTVMELAIKNKNILKSFTSAKKRKSQLKK